MSQHMVVSDFSLKPSDAVRWANCSGYPHMARQFPRSAKFVDKVRDESKAFRAVLYSLGMRFKPIEEGELVHGVEVDEGMIEDAKDVVEYAQAWQCNVMYGVQLHCSRIHDSVHGLADVIGIDKENHRIYVMDARYDYRDVSPVENLKLGCYLAGIAEHYGVPQDGLHDQYWKVEFIVYQPRAMLRRGTPFKRWVFTYADYARGLFNYLINAAERCARHPETLRAGPHCRKCSGAAHCPALRRDNLETLDTVEAYEPETLGDLDAAHELDLLERARLLLETRAEALRIDVENRIREGASIPGWVVEHAPGRIRWKPTSRAVVIDLAQAMKGVDIAKQKEPIAVRAAERLLGSDFIAQHTDKPTGALRLRRQSPNEIRELIEGGKNV